MVLVLVLWVIGWHELAVIVAVAASVIGGVTAVSASARRAVERVFAAVGRAVGQVLTVILLGVVQLVIFAPASLLARLFRTDPLDPLARHGDGTSRWVSRRADERRMPRRQYADERYRTRTAETVVGSPRWLRGAIGGLVLLLAADIALGSLLVRLDDDTDDSPVAAVFAFDPLAQDALAGQADAATTMSDLEAAGSGVADPFIGWRFSDDYVFESTTVNIADGARATSPSPLAAEDPLDVWFFGGSTIYGSGQRDEATIPSWVVRLAADTGTAIRATNFGHPAYANWQQVQLLEHHLTRGGRPDVVIFYDGFNDLTLQTQFGVHDEPTHLGFGVGEAADQSVGAPEETVAETVRDWWSDHSAVARAYDRVADLFRDDPAIRIADTDAAPIDTIDPIAAADAAVTIHRRGVEHVQALGESYGFESLFLWQPFLYTRDGRTAAEEQLVGLPGYDTDVWFPMTERARARLADPVVDLSDVLDHVPGSVFWDFVHTNEEGARLVAESIVPLLPDG